MTGSQREAFSIVSPPGRPISASCHRHDRKTTAFSLHRTGSRDDVFLRGMAYCHRAPGNRLQSLQHRAQRRQLIAVSVYGWPTCLGRIRPAKRARVRRPQFDDLTLNHRLMEQRHSVLYGSIPIRSLTAPLIRCFAAKVSLGRLNRNMAKKKLDFAPVLLRPIQFRRNRLRLRGRVRYVRWPSRNRHGRRNKCIQCGLKAIPPKHFAPCNGNGSS
jgi:hypothetical protein